MRLALVLISLAAMLGCESGATPVALNASVVPVKGKISHRGKPVTKGQIVLEPTDGGRDAKGEIQPDGTFVLSTFGDDDGALIGVHHVAITGADRALPTRKDPHITITQGKNDYAIDLK